MVELHAGKGMIKSIFKQKGRPKSTTTANLTTKNLLRQQTDDKKCIYCERDDTKSATANVAIKIYFNDTHDNKNVFGSISPSASPFSRCCVKR